MRIYVHDSQSLEVVEIERDGSLAELLGSTSVLWAENADEPLEAGATARSLGSEGAAHVHKGSGLIVVKVYYNGREIRRDFGPGSTIERVLYWATGSGGFNIDEATSHDLVLRLPGQTQDLNPSEHIGTLTPNRGDLALDLLPSARFAG